MGSASGTHSEIGCTGRFAGRPHIQTVALESRGMLFRTTCMGKALEEVHISQGISSRHPIT